MAFSCSHLYHCLGNRSGIGLSDRTEDKIILGNLFFNSVCTENREDGILTGNLKAKENCLSQSVAFGNGKENIGVSPTAIFFNIPSAP